jgi:glycosyltransferase involved in cell wall biosynthesis
LALLPGIKVRTLDTSFRLGGISFGICLFLWRQSKVIDVLNLYHFTTASSLYGLIYKLRNSKGILYIKADYSPDIEKYQLTQCSRKRWGVKLRHVLLRFSGMLLNRVVDFVSIEIPETKEMIMQKFFLSAPEFIHVPNGFFLPPTEDRDFSVESFEKENLIVWAGRVGGFEKNLDMFINALGLVRFSNWKVVIAGAVEKAFESKIKHYYAKFPQLTEFVSFTFRSLDRNELYSLYKRSKILCITSLWEGFPLVASEAMFFGNVLLTANLAFAKSLSDDGAPVWYTGENEPELFARALDELVDDLATGDLAAIRAHEYAKSRLLWDDISENLAEVFSASLEKGNPPSVVQFH